MMPIRMMPRMTMSVSWNFDALIAAANDIDRFTDSVDQAPTKVFG